ncbi:MAG: YCF48-related protein [Bacteroidota bacterium]|nr:YCF48-related protein [Bacteroidota bacterium]
MIKNYLLSIVLACSMAFTMQGQQTQVNAGADASITCGGTTQLKASISWIKLSSGTNVNLRSVYFTDKNTGFAIGDSGTILKTTDAGATWAKKSPKKYDAESLKSICFVNKDTGYVIGSESIRKTMDGGETWVHKAGLGGNCIYMTSTGSGLVGTLGGIATITDGDSMSVYFNYQTIYPINAIAFATPSKGYAVGNNGLLIQTTDGGNSWASKGSGTTSNLNAIHFYNSQNGYINGDASILKTTNGGASWTTSTNTVAGGNSIFMTSSSTVYTCSKSGSIYKTTGIGWTKETTPSSIQLNSLIFLDANTGYTVGKNGQIYKYDGNGTFEWTPSTGLSETNIASPTATPITTTNYIVIYTTSDKVSSKDTVTVTVTPATINAGSDQSIHCGETAQLGVTTNYTGSGTLKYKWTPSTGLSNDTIANPVATISANTTYTVTVTTPNGCTSSDQVQISLTPMSSPSLGIVTANSSNNNVVAWLRPTSTAIDSICVYRETNVTNVYKKIGTVAYSAPNQFVDSLSNTCVQSNKYRISVKDHCGFESAQSDPHKSMHLAINQGMNGSWNLIWEPYSGFTVSTYNIYRGTNQQNITLINSTSGSNTQFTDLTAPAGNVYYQIEVISPYSIFVDKQATAQSASLLKSATVSSFPALYYSSRSNVATNNTAGIATITTDDLLSIYPNPAKNNIRISTNNQNGDDAIINIYNTTGSLVKSDILGLPDQSYDISSLSNGIYILELKSGNLTYKKRLIVNK